MAFSPTEIATFAALTLAAFAMMEGVRRRRTILHPLCGTVTNERHGGVGYGTANPSTANHGIGGPTAGASHRSTGGPQVRRLPVLRSTVDSAARATSPVGRFDGSFEKAVSLIQSNWSTREVTWVIVGFGAVVVVAVFAITESASATAFSGLMSVALAVLGVLVVFRRRVQKFQSQLPQAMQLMARAVRAGESLEQAVHLVAESAQDPLRSEFRRSLKQIEMGLPVRAAMKSMSDRMDTMDTRLFGSTLSVHRESGGNLAETLDRLATVIRKRYEYHQRLRSSTGAGRASVILIAALGIFVFSYMFLFRPDYGSEMWSTASGQIMLVFAVASEFIGLIWVFFLLKAKY